MSLLIRTFCHCQYLCLHFSSKANRFLSCTFTKNTTPSFPSTDPPSYFPIENADVIFTPTLLISFAISTCFYVPHTFLTPETQLFDLSFCSLFFCLPTSKPTRLVLLPLAVADFYQLVFFFHPWLHYFSCSIIYHLFTLSCLQPPPPGPPSISWISLAQLGSSICHSPLSRLSAPF